MSFTAYIYRGTGFNSVNVPDSPALLRSMSGATQSVSTEVIQPYRLTSISLAVPSDIMFNADYLELTDGPQKAIYSIDSYEMTSPDIARLTITMDYLLTYMATYNKDSIDDIQFLDGMTVRHHVAKNADVFGNFCEEDPLLIPDKPLRMTTSGNLHSYDGGTVHKLVESRINLTQPGSSALTYTDATTSETVTVPNMDFVQTRGVARVPDPASGTTKTITNPSAEYYDESNTTVMNNITQAQNLNLESGILNSWCIPSGYASVSGSTTADISGRSAVASSGLNFEYQTVNNKRALYGGTTKFILFCPASGSQAEFAAEDICKEGNTNIASPSVTMTADPRPDGRPYYRFQYYLGNSSNFWANCIPGQQWQSSPLNFTQKSGISLDTANFNTSMNIAKQDAQNFADLANMKANQMQTNYDVTGAFGANNDFLSTAGNLGSMLSGGITGTVNSVVSQQLGYYNMGQDYLQANTADKQALQMKQMAMAQEKQQFIINSNFTVPSISFPRSNTIRDILGNGVRVIRVNPASTDIVKFDKVLTMFGYKITEPLKPEHFTNRVKFNFVQATGVSLKGNAPMWLKDGIAAEFSIGKRFWHVRPDNVYYTNGGNV